jgi:hypothetical protein
MKRLVLKYSVAVLIVPLILLLGTSAFTLQSRSDSIKAAYKTGKISREDYVVSSLKTYFSKDMAKSGYTSAVKNRPTREITILLKEASQNYRSYSTESQTYLTRFFLRPTSNTNQFPFDTQPIFYLPEPVLTYEPSASEYPNIGGKYKFWYVTHSTPGGDGVVHTSSLSFVMKVVQALEYTFSITISNMGFPEPLGDNGYLNNPGDDNQKIDIYIMNCGAYDIYGYTTPISSGKTRPAFMVLDNGFTEFANVQTGQTAEQAMEVTVAHEFHHSVQFAINYWADNWIMEATSTWMESQVYPAIHDNLQYLNGDRKSVV